MIKGKDYYQHLIERFMNNDCSPRDAEELFNHIQDHSTDRLLAQKMKESFESILNTKPNTEHSEWSKKMQEDILSKIQSPAKIVSIYKTWLPRVAAAFILFSASLVLYHFYSKSQKVASASIVKTTKKLAPKTEILAGTNKALLTLDDGNVIVLDDAGNGNLAKQGGTLINKKNGQLVYNASPVSSTNPPKITFNTITTPKGGQYKVVLPDGSKVWINAASTLHFPTVFTGNNRIVELNGEGYFEIEKNPLKPFHVKIRNMEVEVLGTHFNIMGYDNEKAIKTTLIEGSVRLNYGEETKTLKPGQQGKFDNGSGNINIANANIEEAIAWKNGFFHFENEDIESIMRQFSRWYNIDVSYEGKHTPRYFSGEVSRNVNLSQALKVLQSTNVEFKIENKKIIIIY